MKRRNILKLTCLGALLLMALTSSAGSSRHLAGQSLLLGREAPGIAPQQTITWGTQADALSGQTGQRFTLICPGNGTLSSRVWGSDVYTDDSSICTAAVHAGLITNIAGGIVVIEIRPGLGSYSSSTRNGVTSRSYGAWRRSFIFVGGQPGGARMYVTWGTQVDSLNGRNGQRFTLVCPANGTLSSRVWGTDLYTNDSSVCTAAVHAGLIKRESGGVVMIEVRPGTNSYQGSTRNGMSSRSYGSWNGSFVFIRP